MRWVGVVHEGLTWDQDSSTEGWLGGDYHIEGRHLGARNLDGQKYAHDRDCRWSRSNVPRMRGRSSTSAQSYFALGDFANARTWYTRRAELGGYPEEVYFALYRAAESMARLDEPWEDIQDAYLRAWELRPIRAEPLYAIARHYREDQRYRLGYLFAELAAGIPRPELDVLFVRADIYGWRIADERAVCASWIDKHTEAFTLCRNLLARSDVRDDDRQRIAANRDASTQTMIEAASAHPEALVQSLQRPGQSDTDVTVSLIAGPERSTTEHTLDSLLNCCTDIAQIGRFLVIDAGLLRQDRATLHDRYKFLEFAQPGQLRAQINARYWLHLGRGWRFFAPENLITRLIAVLEAEPELFQVAINYTDADRLTGASAPEHAVRRAPDTGRYVPTEVVAHGPAMFDTARLDRAGGVDPIAKLGRRAAAAAGLRTATLDEVLCIQQD